MSEVTKLNCSILLALLVNTFVFGPTFAIKVVLGMVVLLMVVTSIVPRNPKRK